MELPKRILPKRILIVDDEEDIRDVVQVALEEFVGWQTCVATSGLEGLYIAQQETLDAILLDISMPDMDGFQLCEALQADPTTQPIPIIVLTANVLPRDHRRLADINVAGIITKPFNPLTIGQQVAELLGWTV